MTLSDTLGQLTANGCRCLWLFLDGDIPSALDAIQKPKVLVCQQKSAKVKSSKQAEFLTYFNSEKCLGKTYDAVVMADIGAITPNAYCQVTETVRRGGIICILASSKFDELKLQAHNKYKTRLWPSPQPLLLKRLYRLVKESPSVVITNAALKIVNKPLAHTLAAATPTDTSSLAEMDWAELQTAEKCLDQCVTVDQRNCVAALAKMVLVDSASFVAITAARGRGKSAALGFFAAIAMSKRRSIVLTAPTEQNCLSLFQMCREVLTKLGLKHRSTDRSVVVDQASLHFERAARITDNSFKLSSEVIVIIDEAATISSPVFKDIVKRLKSLKIPLVVASTIAGYEGTGRSFSLKMLTQMSSSAILTMEEPIRYLTDDPIEKLTYRMFLLDSEERSRETLTSLPEDTQIVAVNKELLFSGNEERSLSDIVSLFVDSHYMNSPNDLMLLADSPGQGLIVAKHKKRILCALQYCSDGGFECDSSEGDKVNGDLITWKLKEWHDTRWDSRRLGLRIVRIATAPWCRRLGLGKLVITRLAESLNAISRNNTPATLPLFHSLEEWLGNWQIPGGLQPSWLGTSFGLTPELFKFWSKSNFKLIHMATSRNEITGEVSCIMLKDDKSSYVQYDFLDRLVRTLHLEPERQLSASFIASIISQLPKTDSTNGRYDRSVTAEDIRRLRQYVDGSSDRVICRAVLPDAARKALLRHPDKFSALEKTIITGIALQSKSPDALSAELGISSGEVVLGQLRKACRKLLEALNDQEDEPSPPPVESSNRQKRQALLEKYKKVARKSL